MNQNSPADHTSNSLWGINLAIGYLLALSILTLLGALFFGLAVGAGAIKTPGDIPVAGVFVIVCLVAGILPSGMLFSFAMALIGIKSEVLLLRRVVKTGEGTQLRLSSVDESLRELGGTMKGASSASHSAAGAEPVPTRSADPTVNSTDLSQLLTVMTELRDTLLMSEPERAAMLKRRLDQKRRGLIEKLHHHLRHEEWKAAEVILQDFNFLFPDDPQKKDLQDELAFAKQRKADLDLSDAQDRIRGWVGSNRWDMVEPLVAKLELQYPDDRGVVDYVRQIRSEMQSWHREELQNLIGQLKDASDHRQWRRASLIAQQLLEKYPDDKLVEKLRSELPTLRKNADLQEVKDLETQFKELLQRRRYDEAFPIAQKVIDEHPETAVANELVKMLPKLQELIKQEKIRRNADLGNAG